MSQKNVEIVRGVLDAFNRGDVEAVVAAFHEDCEIREPPEVPDRRALGFRGHEGVREWMTDLRDVIGVEFEPRSLTTGGDAVLAELLARGEGQASRVPIEWKTFFVIHLRDGKIALGQGFRSRSEALEAAGLRE
jgi:ketosteroid isomerase-like protein